MASGASTFPNPSSIRAANVPPYRHARNTLTIRNDVPTLLAIFSAIEKEFLRKDLPGGFSYMPAMLLQPIYRAQLGGKVDAYKSRNALGLDEDTEPLLRKSSQVSLYTSFTPSTPFFPSPPHSQSVTSLN